MPKPSVVIEGLGDAELAALAKCRGDDLRLSPGDFRLDFMVRVTGLIRKGEPVSFVPTIKIPWTRAMGFMLQFAGLAGEAALKLLGEAMASALDSGRPVDLTVIEQAQAMVADALGKLPREVRDGPVTLLDDLVVRKVDRRGRAR